MLLLLGVMLAVSGCGGDPTDAWLDVATDVLLETPTPISPDPAPETPDPAPEAQSNGVLSLQDFHDPQVFTRNALEHIFVGSVNARGVASGYHSEVYPDARGEVVAGTRSEPDADGVYEAQVQVDGMAKSGNRGYSTFFPSDMTVGEVVEAIRQAYENRVYLNGNTWQGEGGGLIIMMYLDDQNLIISAFPEYGG